MNELIRIRDAEFYTDELAHFLVAAKRKCYAGEGREERLADGSKQLTFQKGNFHYADNYAGYFQALGTEIVRWQKPEGQRVWQMSYAGGMLPGFWNEEFARQTFSFLKKALLQVSPEAPFRGKEFPEDAKQPNFLEGDFSYFAKTRGNIKNFTGIERISHIPQGDVFTQDYIGGLVIPK